jgi:antitoxin component YwqK of YwqJK toxin-antitoxin module
MEMVFMEHRVRSHNKNFLYLLWFVFLVQACSVGNRSIQVIPANDAKLSLVNGIVLYKGETFSGRIYQLYETGDTAVVSPYIDGKQDGWEFKWYSNGKLAEQRLFVNGRKEGVHKGWRDDGTKKFEYHFRHDEHEGELKEWYGNGKPARSFHYNQGHEEGRQQMWWEDGRIRANYIVKEGERFGLLGQKLCKNNIE